MNKLIRAKYLWILWLSGLAAMSPAGLVINEILVSTSTGLLDGFGEYEDWIEIYTDNTPSLMA